MSNEIGKNQLNKLVKIDCIDSDERESEKALRSSKKFAYSKRKIKGICKSLSHDSDGYDPEKTLVSIDAFFEAQDNMGRILYSEISSYVFSLSEQERGTFGANIEKLLLRVLDADDSESEDSVLGEECGSTDKKSEDRRKFVIKLFDHFQLALYQIDNTDNQYAKSIEKTRQELQTEVKGMEKEYISILGIFASIVLAFIGAMTFSTSVLENIGNASIYRIIIISLIIAFVFLNMLWLLTDFIRNINGNQIKRQWTIIVYDVVIAICVILVGVACTFGWLGNA